RPRLSRLDAAPSGSSPLSLHDALPIFGQRRVLLLAGTLNSLALLALAYVAFSALPDAAVLAVGFVIGASSPQIGPFSRSRLVQLILTRLPAERRAKSLNATMGYESAADE